VFEYARGFIEASAVRGREVASMTQTEMRLKNNVVLGVHSNSFRSIRGKTLLARSKEWDGIERLGLKMPRDLPSALAKGSEAFKRIRYSYEGNTEVSMANS
jgi:hypothetical protein